MGKGLRHWDFFNSLPFCTSMSSFMSELNNKGWKGPLCEVWHAQNLPKRKKSATATYWYHLGPNVSFLRNGKPRKMMSHHGCPSPQSCDLWISLWKAFSWWKQLPLPPPLRTTPIPPLQKIPLISKKWCLFIQSTSWDTKTAIGKLREDLVYIYILFSEAKKYKFYMIMETNVLSHWLWFFYIAWPSLLAIRSQ